MDHWAVSKINSRKDFNPIPHSNVCLIYLIFILLAGEMGKASGHLAAFVNAEGKPNSLSGRVIRGPPRNTQSEHQSEFNNDYPSFEQDTYGYTDQKKNFERSLKSIGEDGTWIVQPQGESNPGESTANLWGDDYLDEDSDKNPDTFYPIPYVSAHALGNLPLFFKNLQNNMMALQKEQEDENLMSSLETHSGGKTRWQPPASGLINSDRYRHNTRSFFESPNNNLPSPYMRRAATAQYNPGWKYTRLGLGRRR